MLSTYRLSSRPEVEVAHVALACCSLEVDSAVAGGLLRPVEPWDVPPGHVVLLVSGTVTDALAPAVVNASKDLKATAVIAYGVCASTGGPYWDSPTVTKGIDQLLPVARYVPGCPPRPEALVWAISEACL
ncbi:MAG: hypothetical protein ORN20_02770 [Candidatus Nanopelagicales bacterium]|nr:hypothetical protein [Candidatus Nanopelagicales bacterium]